MDKDNWVIILHRVGRVIFWITGVLFAYWIFPNVDFVSFLLLGMLCGDALTLIFTLAFTYVWFHMMAKSDVTEYELDYLGKDSVKKLAKQMWLGINLSLVPEFVGGVFGVGAGFLIHSWFGWGILGTFLVCIGVGVIAEVLLNFALPILAFLMAAKIERKDE